MTEPIFKLTRVSGQPVTDEELLADLQRVATLNGKKELSQKRYKELDGAYDTKTYHRRFGTWNKALALVEIKPANEINYSDERLFENILTLWQHYGQQPRKAQLASFPSIVSEGPYKRRFSSWMTALEAFVNYANASEIEAVEESSTLPKQRKTGRDPSLRLRWKVLQRDRFTCCACGKSPALAPGVELHVDHIVPWSKGGDTVSENLQTLCSQCNLGKSNVTE